MSVRELNLQILFGEYQGGGGAQVDDECRVHQLAQRVHRGAGDGQDAVRGQPGEGLLPGGQRRPSRLPGRYMAEAASSDTKRQRFANLVANNWL